MRNRLMIGTAALLLASATFARAQDKPQQERPTPSNGTIDIGGRFTSTTGDEARYERYRDLRNGVNANFVFNKETANWTFDVKAQQHRLPRQPLHAELQQQAREGLAPRSTDAAQLRLLHPDAVRLHGGQLHARSRPCAPPGAGNDRRSASPQNVGAAGRRIGLQLDRAARSTCSRAATRSRPTLRFSATDNLDFILGVNSYKRSGNMPYGASFAFNVATRAPDGHRQPGDRAVGRRRVGEPPGDVPRRATSTRSSTRTSRRSRSTTRSIATDFCKTGTAGQATGTCYDPSGYTNGNGPAFGRMAMAPSNTLDTVNWMGMVKLPGHTTANASFTMGANRQDEALIPWTTNSVIANTTAVYAAVPRAWPRCPATRPRCSVNYTTGTMNVSSRPIKDVTLTARYRFNSRSDFTREFDAVEYVRFDAVPEETGGATEPFNINRNTFDVNASFTPHPEQRRSASATATTSASTASGRPRAGRTTRPGSRSTPSATST